MQKLSIDQLHLLPSEVKTPRYKVAERGTGIVHIGIGNFHRAHQALYTEAVLNNTDEAWRIIAVSLRSAGVRDQLLRQDNLYTIAECEGDSMALQVIGAIAKVLVAPEDPAAVIAALASVDTHVITVTVTEKGYCLIPGTRELDLNQAQVMHDITHASQPQTMPGFIVAACQQRMQERCSGFNILSCDNLPENGAVLRHIVLTMARLKDSKLAQWIEQEVRFCSTMVDRIVPATTASSVQKVAHALGTIDPNAVVCEPFKQWVIEDNFIGKRPAWELAGALLVDNVAEYERMKLRLLNGSHSALAYLGHLFGYETIAQAIADPLLHRFVTLLMDEEVTPTLGRIAGVDLCHYKAQLIQRFSNTAVPYRCLQVATDGSQKLPQRNISIALERLNEQKDVTLLALVVAAWFRFLRGETDECQPYAICDPIGERLKSLAQKHQQQPPVLVQALMAHTGIFPASLVQNVHYTALLTDYLERMASQGIRGLVAAVVARYP